jgi:hypothetical protein
MAASICICASASFCIGPSCSSAARRAFSVSSSKERSAASRRSVALAWLSAVSRCSICASIWLKPVTRVPISRSARGVGTRSEKSCRSDTARVASTSSKIGRAIRRCSQSASSNAAARVSSASADANQA